MFLVVRIAISPPYCGFPSLSHFTGLELVVAETDSLPSGAGRGLESFGEGHGKVIEKTFPEQSILDLREVLGIVPFGGPFGTVP